MCFVAPAAPENFVVINSCKKFTLSWNKPTINPDYYQITFMDADVFKNFTISGVSISLK